MRNVVRDGYNIGIWESKGDGQPNVFDFVPNGTRQLLQVEVSHYSLVAAIEGCHAHG